MESHIKLIAYKSKIDFFLEEGEELLQNNKIKKLLKNLMLPSI